MRFENVKDKVYEKTPKVAISLMIAALIFKNQTIDPLVRKFSERRLRNRQVEEFANWLDSDGFDERREKLEIEFKN